jgi:hypothetical protein
MLYGEVDRLNTHIHTCMHNMNAVWPPKYGPAYTVLAVLAVGLCGAGAVEVLSAVLPTGCKTKSL